MVHRKLYIKNVSKVVTNIVPKIVQKNVPKIDSQIVPKIVPNIVQKIVSKIVPKNVPIIVPKIDGISNHLASTLSYGPSERDMILMRHDVSKIVHRKFCT